MAIDIASVPEFYQPYLQKLNDGTVVETLERTADELNKRVSSISEGKGNTAYATGKWTIKEVLQHLIDAERIFCNRALRFAREDKIDLPGFEQNDYVPISRAGGRTLNSLLDEFNHLRKSTIDLFASFDDEMLAGQGTTNGYSFTSQSVGYIIAGHTCHHLTIIKERYL